MFDFGFGYSEMFVVAVVAIIVIGPKDLPKVLRAFGKTIAKMRGMAREFQGHLDQAMKNPANFIEPTMAKKASEDASKKQVDDFNKLFGDAPPADAPKTSSDTPAAAS